MRSDSPTDTNLLLSTVAVFGLALLLSLPEFIRLLGHILSEIWWVMRQMF